MTSIAFFADDAVGPICANMVARALAYVGIPVTLSASGAEGWPKAGGTHELMSLPLHNIRNEGLRARLDVVVTVGEGCASAARALRAARYDAVRIGEAITSPAWFLPLSDQSLLMTKARLASVNGPRLPFGTRALPVMLPRLGAEARRRLLDGRPDDAVLASATLLAALVLAVGAAPAAPGLDAKDLAALMASGGETGRGGLAGQLLALADAYGHLSECEPEAAGPLREPFVPERRSLAPGRVAGGHGRRRREVLRRSA